MGKNKSHSKASKKLANDTTGKTEDGKPGNKSKDGKHAAVSKNKKDNQVDTRTVKGDNDVKSKQSSAGHGTVWIVVGLSIIVGVAAIIYTNEDVQMFFVKLTPLGANPMEYIVQTNQNSADVKQAKPEVITPKGSVQDTQDTIKQTKEDGTIQSSVESSQEKTETKSSETDNLKTEQVKTESKIEDKESNKASESVKAAPEKTDDDSEVKKKKKSAREDYAKSSLTNKADFKIRKKLDAAEDLLKEGELSRAADKFDAILRDNPQSPRALWGKGLVLDKMAEQQRSNALLEESMGMLDRAMRLDNTPLALMEEIGRKLADRQGFREESVGVLDRAMRLDNTPVALMKEIGRKLADRQGFRGWMGKEAATWKYLASRSPDKVEFVNLQGVAYLKMGKIEAARTVFQEVLDRYPDNGFGLVHLGFIVKTSDQNYKEAIPLLQKGIDSGEPGVADARFYTHLGDAYHRVNQTEKAKEIYKKGHALGLFLSEYQRSSYNAETPLTGRPWWTVEQTTYSQHLQLLEKNWKVIREEGLAQLNKNTGSFKPEDENLSDTGDWRQFTLYHRGKKDEAQCKKAPKTCALIDQFPASRDCTRGQVKFSVMHPGVHVWPHTGPTNCRIRAHLGLKVPEGPRIRVADEIRTWKEGKFIIFDDSFEHEVWHDGTETRLILIVDFWHPEIPEWERRSLSPI